MCDERKEEGKGHERHIMCGMCMCMCMAHVAQLLPVLFKKN